MYSTFIINLESSSWQTRFHVLFIKFSCIQWVSFSFVFLSSSSLWFLLKKACSIMPMFFSGQNLWMVFPQFRELLQLSRTSDFAIFLVSVLKRYVLTQFDVYSCNPYMTILLNNLQWWEVTVPFLFYRSWGLLGFNFTDIDLASVNAFDVPILVI